MVTEKLSLPGAEVQVQKPTAEASVVGALYIVIDNLLEVQGELAWEFKLWEGPFFRGSPTLDFYHQYPYEVLTVKIGEKSLLYLVGKEKK